MPDGSETSLMADGGRDVTTERRASAISAESPAQTAAPAAHSGTDGSTTAAITAAGAGTQGVKSVLGDAALLLLFVYLFPVAIFVAGAPVAVLVRLALEIARRW